MSSAINDGTPASTFRLSKEADGFSFSFSNDSGIGSASNEPKKSWHKKAKEVPKDNDGASPEDVHETRYAGIKMELSLEELHMKNNKDVVNPARQALADFQVANQAAEKGLDKHLILLPHQITDKFAEFHKKFDDFGSEVFAVMHMLPAFLSRRADHAPIELTIVRVRLATGVEKGICHLFPSPLPLPLGKVVDFKAGRKEYHEIDELSFEGFNSDYIWIFFKMITTLNPHWPIKAGRGRPPKLPLTVCKDYQVQNTIRMFQYIHERALMAQGLKCATEAPKDFIVPATVEIPFCTLENFQTAVRRLLRECNFINESQILAEPDVTRVNHCAFHQTTNKLTCTTYCVSEMVEHMLTLSSFWSGTTVPSRFVQPYTSEEFIDETDARSFESPAESPVSDSTDSAQAKVKFAKVKTMRTWNETSKKYQTENAEVGEDSDRASIYSESCEEIASQSGPCSLSLGRGSNSLKTSSHSEGDTVSNSDTSVPVIRSRAVRRALRVPKADEVDIRPTADVLEEPATPSPTPMMDVDGAVSEWDSDDLNTENLVQEDQEPAPMVPRVSFRRRLHRVT
ncbi:uncharacterized protein LOC129581790 [Paramacrobiotus metropolitanus]|uniref:uncharacterized protein LOC129581790 n=1 Tax=Paramacrobiotus metropolitanus TaxID=2943436 RepID=UPI002446541A|nr:uncharacterized protein LOC129581790 [Paramacrobiotus metropolitanus]XP_055329003.1 uncharacterized protein LOC129581790 [Paramacrobiotus metropolitanus]XP_055329004.1 uncharacterized protein LOC129581790 [Paramacrobiotus metropolitanus]XP_055329005.1 uncharacterized protein LOC129581790 [Paramacrobiotus metropolitanus]